MATFGQLLQQIYSEYDASDKLVDITSFCSSTGKLKELKACCKNYGYDLDEITIRDFIKNLFNVDPQGKSLDFDFNRNPVSYQDSGAPYEFGVVDYNDRDIDTINKIPVNVNYGNTEWKKPKVRPKCKNPNCKELAYFGLPFCPWCMKQIPPFYPKTKKDTQNIYASSPILDLKDIKTNICKTNEEKVTRMVAGVETTFSLNDVIIKDNDVHVRQRDVERELKNIKKYIPK